MTVLIPDIFSRKHLQHHNPMFIAKGLLVKGLAGLASVLGAGGIAVVCCKDKIWPKEDNTEINKKITETLKLPDGCKFTGNESNNTKECTLTKDQLKAVKFKNIEGESITVTGLDSETETITLEIKKFNTPTEEDKKRYKTDLSSNDLWFTFKNLTKDVTIKKSESDTNNQIKLIKGTNPEFKINNDNKLEKAWTVTELAKKVNLKCPATEGGTEKKCTVETGATISYKVSNNVQQLTTTTQETEKITYEGDQQNYNQGFKFTVASGGITVSSNTLAEGDYEIKYEEGENKGWYLAKKTSTNT